MSMLAYQSTIDPIVVLSNLARRKAHLRLSHPFHGVVLTRDLSLISLNPDRALVQIGHDWLPTNPGNSIYVHSPDASEVLAARVLATNFQSGELALGDFSLVGRSWAERGFERVQPRQPIHVQLRVFERSFTAALEDFSLNGAGVLTYKLRERGFDLSPGQPLRLEFELPKVRGRFSLAAHLVNIRHHGDRLTCLGINILPNFAQSRALSRYVAQRKAEIMDELEQVLNETLQPQSVKELYF